MAAALVNGLRHRGILVGTAGRYGYTLNIRPPLCFTQEHVALLVSACAAVLDDFSAPR